MSVATLRAQIEALLTLLERSGTGQKATKELVQLHDGLAAYDELTIAQLIKRLECGEAAGSSPPTPKPAKRSAAKESAPSAEFAEVLQEVQTLYDNIRSPELDFDQIDSVVKRVNSLKMADAKRVAKEIGIPGNFKTKKLAVEAIKERLGKARENYVMTRF